MQRDLVGFKTSYRRYLAIERRKAVLEALQGDLEGHVTIGELVDTAETLGYGEGLGELRLQDLAEVLSTRPDFGLVEGDDTGRSDTIELPIDPEVSPRRRKGTTTPAQATFGGLYGVEAEDLDDFTAEASNGSDAGEDDDLSAADDDLDDDASDEAEVDDETDDGVELASDDGDDANDDEDLEVPPARVIPKAKRGSKATKKAAAQRNQSHAASTSPKGRSKTASKATKESTGAAAKKSTATKAATGKGAVAKAKASKGSAASPAKTRGAATTSRALTKAPAKGTAKGRSGAGASGKVAAGRQATAPQDDDDDGELEGDRMSVEQAAQILIPVIRGLDEATMQTIEDATGMGRRKLRFHIGQLVRTGYLKRHGMGRGTYYTAR